MKLATIHTVKVYPSRAFFCCYWECSAPVKVLHVPSLSVLFVFCFLHIILHSIVWGVLNIMQTMIRFLCLMQRNRKQDNGHDSYGSCRTRNFVGVYFKQETFFLHLLTVGRRYKLFAELHFYTSSFGYAYFSSCTWLSCSVSVVRVSSLPISRHLMATPRVWTWPSFIYPANLYWRPSHNIPNKERFWRFFIITAKYKNAE